MGVIVNKCCCGCSLQTGTKIIGSFHLVVGLISLITVVVITIIYRGIPVIVLIFTPVGIASFVIWIAVTIPVLIAASKNRRPGLLLPWLILNFLAILFGLGYGLYNSIATVLPFYVGSGIVQIISIILGCALGIYFWLVIYSYRQELKEQLPLLPGGKIGGILNVISNVLMMLSNSGGVFQFYGAIFALVCSSIMVVVSIPVLIAASKNRRPGLLLPWLILILIQLFLATGFFLFLFSAIVLPNDMISGIIGIVMMSLTFEDYYFSIAWIVGWVVSIAVTIPLLIAAHGNRRPKLLLPWLILNVIELILSIGSMLFLSIAVILPLDLFAGTIYIVIVFLGFALATYFWLVIFSYHQQLQEMERRPNSANEIPMLEANQQRIDANN
uniref:Transmembrane protein n=1 Tax=Daphnia galeata TaxID=27404 RepID=A0A8J2WS31_9CRUS|nr:unnamed protein product [Daphnia galeata]